MTLRLTEKTWKRSALCRRIRVSVRFCLPVDLLAPGVASQLILLVSCRGAVQELFEAFSKCAELNPDDDEEDDGTMMMGEEGDWIYNADEVADGARAAQISAHLDSILQISPALEMQTECGQFDDADESDEDADGLL